MDANRAKDDSGPPDPSAIGEGVAENGPAWEMLTNGRYMPRRIRGSCQGRELG